MAGGEGKRNGLAIESITVGTFDEPGGGVGGINEYGEKPGRERCCVGATNISIRGVVLTTLLIGPSYELLFCDAELRSN